MSKRLLPPLMVVILGVALASWFMFSPYWQAIQRIGTVMRLVNTHYVDAERVAFDQLAEAAIRGIMDSLDTYSTFLPPEDLRRFEENTQQRFVGIGVEIEQVGSQVLVMTVFDSGPAQRAGVLPGDRITRVEGEDSSSWNVSELSRNLRGEAGTSVNVEVTRGVDDTIYALSITRGSVRTPSVEAVRMLDDTVGYLRIRQFGERTAHEVELAVARLQGMGMQALILDLRGNPGGLLTASKDVAGLFMERGELIVFTAGRNPRDRRDFHNHQRGPVSSVPIAVLINGSSASGAEIVAGALQASGRATVMGEPSHGKGSVQSVFGFRQGGGIRQTTARYFLANGVSIEQSGVTPDIRIEQTQEQRVRLRLQERHLPLMTPERFTEIFGFEPNLADEPLEQAVSKLTATLLQQPNIR